MNFTVKEVGEVESKSMQEVEQGLLEKHEKELNNEPPVVETPPVVEPPVKKEIDDTDVLSFIKSKYDKDISSVDDLFKEDLPEDVSAFLKYKKETGRGIDDYVKLNVDYDKVDETKLLANYYAATEEDLDDDDIDYLLSDKFSYDEELDDDSEIKQKKIAKKKELAKAKKYFNDLKDTYKIPAESARGLVSEEEKESYEVYKKYIQESQVVQEQNKKKYDYFKEKTDSIFSDEFKGFEFSIGDQKVIFNSGETGHIKESQSDVNNFISKFLDNDGLITDAKGYHKALNAAMNPDKLASYFYEKGKADAVGNISRQSKNVNINGTPQQINNSGFKVSSLDSNSGRGLKIRSKK